MNQLKSHLQLLFLTHSPSNPMGNPGGSISPCTALPVASPSSVTWMIVRASQILPWAYLHLLLTFLPLGPFQNMSDWNSHLSRTYPQLPSVSELMLKSLGMSEGLTCWSPLCLPDNIYNSVGIPPCSLTAASLGSFLFLNLTAIMLSCRNSLFCLEFPVLSSSVPAGLCSHLPFSLRITPWSWL